MPARIGEPRRIGGSDHLPTWQVSLSNDPSPDWRWQFLQHAHTDGFFSGRRIAVEAVALVFEIERPALALACEKIDLWIVLANGRLSEASEDGIPQDQRTILVVDDDPHIGPMAADILADGANYIVLHTTYPMEAIRLAWQRPGNIDLLLVDFKMPVMGGIELARRVLVLRPKLKVILMSGGYQITDAKESSWPVLEKPFAIDTLRQMVASALSGPPPT